MTHLSDALALTFGEIVGGASVAASVIGLTSCWMGLKVTQLCRQKESALPQGSCLKTACKIGRVAGSILAGLSALLALVSSAAGGLALGMVIGIIVSPYLTISVVLQSTVGLALMALGLVGMCMPTALCVSKLFKHYRSSLPLPCCAG